MIRQPLPEVVRYKLRGGRWHPMLRFALEANGRFVRSEAYVDSGAYYSVFAPSVAEELGLDFKIGRRRFLRGIGGAFIEVWTHRLRVHIGPHHFPAEVGFSDHLGVGFNLLGRKDIFTRLSFTFNDKHRILLINRTSVLPASLRALLRA